MRFSPVDPEPEVPATDALLAKTKAWLDRSDPQAAALVANRNAEADARETRAREAMQQANREFFIRQCQADGLDVDSPVSPSLLHHLGGGPRKATP